MPSPLKFVVNERGKQKLVNGGFMFLKDKVVGDVTHWRCDMYQKKHCRVCLHTFAGKIVRHWKDHPPHLGDAALIEATELWTQIRDAGDSSSLPPKVVIADCLKSVSQSALAALPNVSHLKQNVQNVRAKKCDNPKLLRDPLKYLVKCWKE